MFNRSTAQIMAWNSNLQREENRSTRRKTLGVRLRSTNLSPHADLIPGRRGGRCDWWPLRQPDSQTHLPFHLVHHDLLWVLVFQPFPREKAIFKTRNNYSTSKIHFDKRRRCDIIQKDKWKANTEGQILQLNKTVLWVFLSLSGSHIHTHH